MPDQPQPTPSGTWETTFVEQMIRLREMRQMSQTDLAKRLKAAGLPFHQQTVQRIENGERPVRLNEAFLIANELRSTVQSMTSEDEFGVRHIRNAVDDFRRTAASIAEQISNCLETLQKEGVEVTTLFSVRADQIERGVIVQGPWEKEYPEPLAFALAGWAVRYIDIQETLTSAFEVAATAAGQMTGRQDIDQTWETMLPQGIDPDIIDDWLQQLNIDRDDLLSASSDLHYLRLNGDAWESQIPYKIRERMAELDQLWSKVSVKQSAVFAELRECAEKIAQSSGDKRDRLRDEMVDITIRFAELNRQSKEIEQARKAVYDESATPATGDKEQSDMETEGGSQT